MSKRKAIGIVLDYSLRIPTFVENYKMMRQQISLGTAQMSGATLDEEDLATTKKSFWDDLREKDPKAAEFYETLPMPTDNMDLEDISYRKYFYSPEHRIQFLTDWSYNLFGQGSVTNKVDVTLLNIAQSKLFDVVIIDRCTHTRKVGNTFAFLARAGLFPKQIIFVNSEDEIDEFAKQKHVLDVWNPFDNKDQIILPTAEYGQPSKNFLTWLEAQEKKTK